MPVLMTAITLGVIHNRTVLMARTYY